MKIKLTYTLPPWDSGDTTLGWPPRQEVHEMGMIHGRAVHVGIPE
jgi:hypothetical protein